MISASLQLSAANREALRSGRVRLVLVGTSGWLASAALAMLDRSLSGEEMRRAVLPFGSAAREIDLPSGRRTKSAHIETLADTDLSDCVILHLGYLAKEKTLHMSVDDYVAANDAIQDHVMRAITANPPRALFFASSGGVYQARVPGHPTRDENLYGWMKVKHETLFKDMADEFGFSLVNGRIFSLAGEFINKLERYALSSFLCDLEASRAIRLSSDYPVWRSYTYVADVVNLALALMIKRVPATSFDIAGSEAIEIGALASLCARVTGRDAHIVRPAIVSDKAADRMIGDYEMYHELLEREGIEAMPLDRQVAATAAYLHARDQNRSDMRATSGAPRR